ncbi:putative glycoside hydrolase/deacetylase ChbG (UPF0249 family) [Deinobacterium chartae]|uniref:Putative glycoside hydrolase/deacetylase ChbG (UPF0249 family) n=1 Tax=Deinobacterium chartae TaxID=521158 RepID=A0A841HXA0_9DEIO|nr:hypothetical protein [Deinobacterium chartae]MBB6098027.1 putative glycoside hydrolase/deacetylase ChbG (UPF0249 family) [Deinobacterium chartae]
MVNLSIHNGILTVHLSELNAFKTTLRVPLAQVRSAELDPRELEALSEHFNLAPYPQQFEYEDLFGKRRVLWTVRNPERAIGISLEGTYFDRLILEVPEPIETVGSLRRAAGFR